MTSKVEMQNLMEQGTEPFIAPPQQQETFPMTSPSKGDTRRRRPVWDQKNNPMEFLVTTLGYLQGLNVLTQMPYLTYRQGGVVFLIQYLLALLSFGVPILFLEMYIGQFTSNGILTCWEMFPLFTGVGYAMLVICMVITSYYAVINAWLVYYMCASLVMPSPWESCSNQWNTPSCYSLEYQETYNISLHYIDYEYEYTEKVFPSVEYWHHSFLQLGNELGGPLWYIALPLLGTWIFVGLILLFGPKVYGKVAYVTTFLPYLMATVLFVRCITLPGASNGLLYLFVPNYNYFVDYKSWLSAANAAFYHMGVCLGPIITLSSYNSFRNDIVRDAFLLPIAHFVSCIGYSMLIFAIYGFLAETADLEMHSIVAFGVEALFTAIATAFTKVPGSQFWSCLFYMMAALLCTSSLLAMAETVITAVVDLIPRLHRLRYLVVMCVCCVLFPLGLPYTLHIGYALLSAMDNAIYVNMPLVGLIEVICVAFMYGAFSYVFTNRAFLRFKDDLRLMFGGKGCHCIPWTICWPFWAFKWCIIVPLIFLACWLWNVSNVSLSLHYFELSWSLKSFCFFVMLTPVLAIVITPLVLVCIKIFKARSLSLGLEYLIKPSRFWGPAQPQDRQGMSGYLPSDKFEVDPWHGV